jgi:hypothetical protein
VDHFIEVAAKVSWPGACVLIALITGIAVTLVSIFGDWPALIKKTVINNYSERPDTAKDNQ